MKRRMQLLNLRTLRTPKIPIRMIRRYALLSFSHSNLTHQNWSLPAKLSTYLTICFYTFLANVNSSNFTVATKPIIAEFHVSQTQAGELVCFNVFLFGLGNIFWVPLMRVIGKRPVYLLSMAMLCMMNVWSSKASSYGELLASRILSGFGLSGRIPCEAR